MSLKIISQNVMCWQKEQIGTYEQRRPLLKKVFRDHGADIIGMQEVTEYWEKAFDEDLHDFGKLLVYRGQNNKEAVPIYWRKDNLKPLDSGYFWLSETPEKESIGWNASCLRITCWVLFEQIDTGKKFAFVNTHLDHISKEARINGIQLICDFINNRFGKEMPLILVGDFNTLPDSETSEKAKSLLNDARSIARETTDELTFHAYNPHAACTIDYIYLSDNISCNKFEVIKELNDGNPQSDHYGIMAEITI